MADNCEARGDRILRECNILVLCTNSHDVYSHCSGSRDILYLSMSSKFKLSSKAYFLQWKTKINLNIATSMDQNSKDREEE